MSKQPSSSETEDGEDSSDSGGGEPASSRRSIFGELRRGRSGQHWDVESLILEDNFSHSSQARGPKIAPFSPVGETPLGQVRPLENHEEPEAVASQILSLSHSFGPAPYSGAFIYLNGSDRRIDRTVSEAVRRIAGGDHQGVQRDQRLVEINLRPLELGSDLAGVLGVWFVWPQDPPPEQGLLTTTDALRRFPSDQDWEWMSAIRVVVVGDAGDEESAKQQALALGVLLGPLSGFIASIIAEELDAQRHDPQVTGNVRLSNESSLEDLIRVTRRADRLLEYAVACEVYRGQAKANLSGRGVGEGAGVIVDQAIIIVETPLRQALSLAQSSVELTVRIKSSLAEERARARSERMGSLARWAALIAALLVLPTLFIEGLLVEREFRGKADLPSVEEAVWTPAGILVIVTILLIYGFLFHSLLNRPCQLQSHTMERIRKWSGPAVVGLLLLMVGVVVLMLGAGALIWAALGSLVIVALWGQLVAYLTDERPLPGEKQ